MTKIAGSLFCNVNSKIWETVTYPDTLSNKGSNLVDQAGESDTDGDIGIGCEWSASVVPSETMGGSLNYHLAPMLTHVLASNAIAAIGEYNKHEKDKFILLTTGVKLGWWVEQANLLSTSGPRTPTKNSS